MHTHKRLRTKTSFNISFKTSGTGGSAWTATKGDDLKSHPT